MSNKKQSGQKCLLSQKVDDFSKLQIAPNFRCALILCLFENVHANV